MGSEAQAAQIVVNGRHVPLDEPDLARLLSKLGYSEDRPGIAVAVNGRIVPRTNWRGHLLAGGDEVDIVGAVAGG